MIKQTVAITSTLLVFAVLHPITASGSHLTDEFCNAVRMGLANGPQASQCDSRGLDQNQKQTAPVTRVESRPIANAGPNQAVSRGSVVTLDGTGSTPGSTITTPPGTITQGTITTYSWAQTSGILVNLTGATTATPTFIAPTVSTALAFRLTVTDSLGLTSSPARTTVTAS
jgi:hypothetical protein